MSDVILHDYAGSPYGEKIRTILGLVTSTPDEVVLRREHPEVGTVMLHFPRVGFEILPA